MNEWHGNGPDGKRSDERKNTSTQVPYKQFLMKINVASYSSYQYGRALPALVRVQYRNKKKLPGNVFINTGNTGTLELYYKYYTRIEL